MHYHALVKPTALLNTSRQRRLVPQSQSHCNSRRPFTPELMAFLHCHRYAYNSYRLFFSLWPFPYVFSFFNSLQVFCSPLSLSLSLSLLRSFSFLFGMSSTHPCCAVPPPPVCFILCLGVSNFACFPSKPSCLVLCADLPCFRVLLLPKGPKDGLTESRLSAAWRSSLLVARAAFGSVRATPGKSQHRDERDGSKLRLSELCAWA